MLIPFVWYGTYHFAIDGEAVIVDVGIAVDAVIGIDVNAVIVDVGIAWLRHQVWRLSGVLPSLGLLFLRTLPSCFHAPLA